MTDPHRLTEKILDEELARGIPNRAQVRPTVICSKEVRDKLVTAYPRLVNIDPESCPTCARKGMAGRECSECRDQRRYEQRDAEGRAGL